jgi:hypothetical protein
MDTQVDSNLQPALTEDNTALSTPEEGTVSNTEGASEAAQPEAPAVNPADEPVPAEEPIPCDAPRTPLTEG